MASSPPTRNNNNDHICARKRLAATRLPHTHTHAHACNNSMPSPPVPPAITHRRRCRTVRNVHVLWPRQSPTLRAPAHTGDRAASAGTAGRDQEGCVRMCALGVRAAACLMWAMCDCEPLLHPRRAAPGSVDISHGCTRLGGARGAGTRGVVRGSAGRAQGLLGTLHLSRQNVCCLTQREPVLSCPAAPAPPLPPGRV